MEFCYSNSNGTSEASYRLSRFAEQMGLKKSQRRGWEYDSNDRVPGLESKCYYHQKQDKTHNNKK
jgi:hypothetical protein